MLKQRFISIVILSVLLFALGAVLMQPTQVMAQDTGIEFKPQTTIPGSEFVQDRVIDIKADTLGKYISAIYNYGLAVVSMLAVFMIMIGGFQWITAAGNSNKIDNAKNTISSAIIGLVLALSSYMLLSAINPDLVELKPLSITPVQVEGVECFSDAAQTEKIPCKMNGAECEVNEECYSKLCSGVEGEAKTCKSYIACESNSDCRDNQICTDEPGMTDQCITQSPTCNSAADCSSGSENNGWADGRCVEDDYTEQDRCDCNNNGDCAEGYKCIDNKDGNDVCLQVN